MIALVVDGGRMATVGCPDDDNEKDAPEGAGAWRVRWALPTITGQKKDSPAVIAGLSFSVSLKEMFLVAQHVSKLKKINPHGAPSYSFFSSSFGDFGNTFLRFYVADYLSS